MFDLMLSGGSPLRDKSSRSQPSGHWLDDLGPLIRTRAWTDTIVLSAARCFVAWLALIKLINSRGGLERLVPPSLP